MNCIRGRDPHDRHFGRCLPRDNFCILLYVFGWEGIPITITIMGMSTVDKNEKREEGSK